ncbi:MAG TPA: glycosyltransferase family 87 protein [Sphingomicrobium sp.]|nr:glycosyltransferase family 87 protein [Sphingomicrobium sp.]
MGAVREGNWLDAARVRRVAMVCLMVSAAAIILLFATAHGTLDWKGRPVGTDFSQMWTAGQMAWDGRAAEVWDWPSHFAVQQSVHGSTTVDLYGWHYPPPFLIIAAALATMPYLAALIAWQAATLAPLALLGQHYLGRRDGWLFVVAAPVTLICIAHGHNGFLTALLLGGGLILLDRKPLLAGVLLGCLVYKPQFALVIPLLLLVTRQWRAIFGAALSSIALIALTLAIWGWPVWQAFLDSLPLTRDLVIEQGRTGWEKIMSPFAAVRSWGLAIGPSYFVQAGFSLAAIGASLWLAWRSRPALRNAATTAAVLIATPYVLDYDYVVLLLGIGILWKDGEQDGWGSWERTLLAFAWIVPLIARSVAEATLFPLGLVSALAVLGIALRRGIRASPSRR